MGHLRTMLESQGYAITESAMIELVELEAKAKQRDKMLDAIREHRRGFCSTPVFLDALYQIIDRVEVT